MATVTVTAAAARSRNRKSKHRKVTLTGAGQTLTFDLTDPEVEFDNLADRWAQVDRPGRKPFMERVGEQLRTVRLEVLIGTDPYRSAQVKLVWLAYIARGPYEGRQVALGYSKFESSQYLTTSGFWVVTDLQIRSVRRLEGSNTISQARVVIALTESAPSRRLARPGASPNKGRDNDRDGRKPRRHTVKAGQTLSSISRKYYGTPNRWRRIAEANRIRDPRKIRPGQVLKIP